MFLNPSNGIATVNLDGSIQYDPAPNYFGTDSFTYSACDPGGLCDQAIVSITINSVEDTPIAVDDNYAVNEDATLVIPGAAGAVVLANDSDGDPGDVLTATRLTDPAHGTCAFP